MLLNLRTADSLLGRTLTGLKNAWRVTEAEAAEWVVGLDQDLAGDDRVKLTQQLQNCLSKTNTPRLNSAALGHLIQLYHQLSDTGRRRFLQLLLAEFHADRSRIVESAQQVRSIYDLERDPGLAVRLRHELIPPYLQLLTGLRAVRGGMQFLLDMHADTARYAMLDSSLVVLRDDLRDLLGQSLQMAELSCCSVTWQSSAALLEQLASVDAVLEPGIWDDIKYRLQSDRRCYACYHPLIPDMPLIVAQLALMCGMPESLHDILDPAAPEWDARSADTAIIYSLRELHPGMQGLELGTFLTAELFAAVRREAPSLQHFYVMAPIPGFRHWIRGLDGLPVAVSKTVAQCLQGGVVGKHDWSLDKLLSQADWHHDAAISSELQIFLRNLCAHYLVNVREGQRVADPTAHFHFSNGAVLEQLLWMADPGPEGLAKAAGMMAVYAYPLEALRQNSEQYLQDGIVASQLKP